MKVFRILPKLHQSTNLTWRLPKSTLLLKILTYRGQNSKERGQNWGQNFRENESLQNSMKITTRYKFDTDISKIDLAFYNFDV